MTFLGLPAAQLVSLFAAGGAALTVLYLLKQQRRRVEVPFIRLWNEVLRQSATTSLWRQILRLLSLLVQLLVLALLVVSLGDPRLGRSEKGRTLVLLIDASASMQALVSAPVARTRLDLAKEQAKELIRSLGGDDLAVVIALDGQPAPMGGLSYDEHELQAQVDKVEARDTPADLSAGLNLARALLSGRSRPVTVLFSDGGFDENTLKTVAVDPGIDLRFQPLAARAVPKPGTGNAAITAFSVRRYRRNRLSYEVLIGLAWFPSSNSAAAAQATPMKATLELLQEGEVVDVQTVELAAGQPLARLYPNLSGAGRHLTARLQLQGATDLLPLDDKAFTVLPERRRQRVLIVTRGNLFLEGALLAASAGEENHLSIDKVTPAAYDPDRADRYDVVIFDAVTPKAPPAAHSIYLDPQGPDSPFPIATTIKAPLLTDVDIQHPVLRWVSLGDVNLSRGSVFQLRPEDHVLAAMLKQPLIVARDETALGGFPRRSLAFGFDLRQSDLPLRVAFPVLLMNALDWFAGDVDDDLGSLRTGQMWRIPLQRARRRGDTLSPGSAAASLLLPDSTLVPVPVSEGYALHYGQRVGFYELDIAGQPPRRFAANLGDLTESAAAWRSELRLAGKLLRPPEPGQRALRRTVWPYLLFLAFLLLSLEWLSYHRRWTV
jgi:hypothetical protein